MKKFLKYLFLINSVAGVLWALLASLQLLMLWSPVVIPEGAEIAVTVTSPASPTTQSILLVLLGAQLLVLLLAIYLTYLSLLFLRDQTDCVLRISILSVFVQPVGLIVCLAGVIYYLKNRNRGGATTPVSAS